MRNNLIFLIFFADETVCSLKGFDIGSRCMVWSGVKWFKAQILGISAEGTKVRGLYSVRSVISSLILCFNDFNI